MMGSLLLAASLLLLVASGSPDSGSSRGPDSGSSRGWPCPNPEDILPCVCSADPDFELTMDCSLVGDNAELGRVFEAHFPFPDFKALVIAPLVPSARLTALEAGAFGRASFRSVVVSNTAIRAVEDGALDASAATLVGLELALNRISSFPFGGLPSFAALRYLLLDDNELAAAADVASPSLEVLGLSGNRGLSLAPTTFAGAGELRGLYLRATGLAAVPPGAFGSLGRVRVIDLSFNAIAGELPAASVDPPGKTLRDLRLGNNSLTGIDAASITGLASSGKVSFRGNLIELLERENWRPLLDQVTGDDVIDLRDNQLTCGCDVFWLVSDRVSMNKIHKETRCLSGERLHDLPESIFIGHCP